MESKYKIRDIVYHINDDEQRKGIVIDVLYSVRYNEFRYLVSFGRYSDDQLTFLEDELNDTKIIF